MLYFYFYFLKKVPTISSNNQYCDDSVQCDGSLGLNCSNHLCICASNSQYWNGTTCVDKLTINEVCNPDICLQCNNLVGLVCQIDLNGNTFCECSLYQYWNGSLCLNLETINQPCTNSSQCNSYDGLFCNASICSCHPLYTWNETTCGKLKLN